MQEARVKKDEEGLLLNPYNMPVRYQAGKASVFTSLGNEKIEVQYSRQWTLSVMLVIIHH